MITSRGPTRSTTQRVLKHAVGAIIAIGATLVCTDGSVCTDASAGASPPPHFAPLADEIVALVRARFMDPHAAARWADRNAGYGAGVADADAFDAETARRLDELNVSHTGRFTPRDAAYAALVSIFGTSLGVEPEPVDTIGVEIDDEGVIRRVLAGGAAMEAGLLRGDRILMADDRPFHPVRSIAGHAGRPVTLLVERGAGVPTITVQIVPRRMPLSDEWRVAQRLGTEVVELGGVRVGVIPVVSCAGAIPREALERTLEDWAHGVRVPPDALVLDLRGGWGGCSPDLMDLFSRLAPDLRVTGRDGATLRVDHRWRGPLVALVDERTRSGKEIVARAIQKHGRGIVVGRRTAGAVVGGQCFRLADGSILYLAVVDVHSDGERLEGVGVTPDVVVNETVMHAAGADPPLYAAVAEAARLTRAADAAP